MYFLNENRTGKLKTKYTRPVKEYCRMYGSKISPLEKRGPGAILDIVRHLSSHK